MAPSRIDASPAEESYQKTTTTSKKSTGYIIDTLHPDAMEYAKTKFNVILPSDPECQNWRQNATSLLVRGSYITAEDIKNAPNLMAIGK